MAGYRIVWRDTTAPFWQHHQDVPANQTRVTVPINKDDVIFGLQAVRCHRSWSAVWRPIRRRA